MTTHTERMKAAIHAALPTGQLGPAVWDPEQGLEAFKAAIDPNGIMIKDDWYTVTSISGPLLVLPRLGDNRHDYWATPGQAVTLLLTAS